MCYTADVPSNPNYLEHHSSMFGHKLSAVGAGTWYGYLTYFIQEVNQSRQYLRSLLGFGEARQHTFRGTGWDLSSIARLRQRYFMYLSDNSYILLSSEALKQMKIVLIMYFLSYFGSNFRIEIARALEIWPSSLNFRHINLEKCFHLIGRR